MAEQGKGLGFGGTIVASVLAGVVVLVLPVVWTPAEIWSSTKVAASLAWSAMTYPVPIVGLLVGLGVPLFIQWRRRRRLGVTAARPADAMKALKEAQADRVKVVALERENEELKDRVGALEFVNREHEHAFAEAQAKTVAATPAAVACTARAMSSR